MTSIRRWLLTWLILGLATSGLIAAFSIFQMSRDEANELFDYELRTVALSLPANFGDAGASSATPDFGGISDDRLVIDIWDQQGNLSYQSIKGLTLKRYPKGYRTIERDEYSWRVFGVHQGDRFVQVAQPISVRDDLAIHLASRTLWPLWVFIPVTIVLVLFVVSRGLEPIRGLSRVLSARTSDSLDPVQVDGTLPIEIEPLVDELNGLLHRLSVASQAQRTFVADAAHELRSPLAALKLQLQVAAREGTLVAQDHTLEHIEQRLNRVIHLVQQLLTLAREDAPGSLAAASVSLRRLAEQAVGDLSLLAEAKEIDLGLECKGGTQPDDRYVVIAEGRALTTLLNNLIDNAIRYTPRGGTVDVVLLREPAGITLEVSDSGPGIPQEERRRVFDRFFRGADAQEQGSGLGLAIASKIVERHHARLTLENHAARPGLAVRVAGLRPDGATS